MPNNSISKSATEVSVNVATYVGVPARLIPGNTIRYHTGVLSSDKAEGLIIRHTGVCIYGSQLDCVCRLEIKDRISLACPDGAICDARENEGVTLTTTVKLITSCTAGEEIGVCTAN